MAEDPPKRSRTVVRAPESEKAVTPEIDPDLTMPSQVGKDLDATVPSDVGHDTDSTMPSHFDTDSTVPSEVGNSAHSNPSRASIAPNQTTLIKKKRGAKQDKIQIGSIIRDRFVIEKILGSGGMGAVYRALDLRKHEAGDNDPYIAIKLLIGNFQYHSDAFITLQREAKKTNALAHPNIVTVYDFDRDGDMVYLTMEELKGHALSDIIKGRTNITLDYKQKVSIIDQIAKGLSYAHSKGIVHSDLKPANIFITEKLDVKLLDFGIARAANEELFQDNFDAGKLGALTFAYASLEMIQFDPPHPSDDIYALGIIACELLDGSHPYERKDAKQVKRLKLKPKNLNVKNPFLKKCLYKAIELQREHRIQDAKQFLKRFHKSRTAPKRYAITALVLTALISINALYIGTIEPELVPFDSLTQVEQNQFHAYIKEGHQALKFGDLQGAVINFNDAFVIHQSHDDIIRAQKIIMSILNKNLVKANEKEKAFIQQQIDSLKEYPMFSEKTMINDTK